MKLSTEIGSASHQVGEARAIETVAAAGFDAWDFSMFCMTSYNWDTGVATLRDHPLCKPNYLAFARELRHIGEECGIVCNQAHAPFPVSAPPIRAMLQRAIECTAEAGGKICVIHPVNHFDAERNAEFFAELLPFAKSCGVKIATENMWGWDDTADCATFAACATPESFCAHIDLVNDENFVACLDLGHAEMRGLHTSATELIYGLGHRLAALHIHDNDKWKDLHRIPFSHSIDFAAIARALRDIGYAGDLTLEADTHLSRFTPDTILTGMTEMANSLKRFAEMF